MTEMDEFIAGENIKSFEAQRLESAKGKRRNTISQLLADEKLRLRDGLSGNKGGRLQPSESGSSPRDGVGS